MTNSTDIELADAIASVRDQVLEAALRATGQPVSFELGPIEMEFAVELRREVTGGNKVTARVVEAAGEGARATGGTHRVSFTLKPQDARTGRPWKVGIEDPVVDVSDFGTSGCH
ncbi:trypco2 family protein [Streptomyces sp. CC210A]|uniref:trypco2 family protein n=1 Tax=Streptomyces sp. CC210A TaxID=2898184 RepID=UPI001F2F0B5B|nr:trypco2 family protein [Streptomyces sp. CC210A]